MLKVENISTGYGKRQVLFDVSFEVKEGEVVLLTGGNGSGKSTLLRTIYRLLPLWSGKILFNETEIKDDSSSQLIEKGMAYIPQKDFLFENLSVEDNLKIAGNFLNKKNWKERKEKVYDLLEIGSLKNKKPFSLSGGEKKLVAFGCALILTPKLIMFDEPISALDARHTILIKESLHILSKENVSLLIVEHKSLILDFDFKKLELSLGKLRI